MSKGPLESNGFVLSMDCHRLFEFGYFTVDRNLKSRISNSLEEDYANGMELLPLCVGSGRSDSAPRTERAFANQVPGVAQGWGQSDYEHGGGIGKSAILRPPCLYAASWCGWRYLTEQTRALHRLAAGPATLALAGPRNHRQGERRRSGIEPFKLHVLGVAVPVGARRADTTQCRDAHRGRDAAICCAPGVL